MPSSLSDWVRVVISFDLRFCRHRRIECLFVGSIVLFFYLMSSVVVIGSRVCLWFDLICGAVFIVGSRAHVL